MERKYHRVCKLFPPMPDAEYQRLVEDIKKRGQLDDIWVHPEDGSIIDGRHRYKACLELGIEPRCREWDGQGSLVEFVLSLNLHRRHLTPSQLALVGVEALPLLREEAERRMKAGTAQPGEKGKSATKAGELVGVSDRMIEHAEKVKEKGAPELQEAAWSSGISVSAAAALTDLPHSDQAKIVQGGKKAVAQAAKALKPPRSASTAGGSVAVVLPDPAPQSDPQALQADPGAEPFSPKDIEDIIDEVMVLLHGVTQKNVETLIERLMDYLEYLQETKEMED